MNYNDTENRKTVKERRAELIQNLSPDEARSLGRYECGEGFKNPFESGKIPGREIGLKSALMYVVGRREEEENQALERSDDTLSCYSFMKTGLLGTVCAIINHFRQS